MHSTLGAYFQSDNFIMEAYSKGRDKTSSISKLNWVHIESLWVVVLETSPEDKYWNETNSYIMITNIYPSGNCWHVTRRPHDHCAVALAVTTGWSSDVRTILWALQGHRGATLRAPYDYLKSLRSFFLGQITI